MEKPIKVRICSDDRDLVEVFELVMFQGANGDWYITIVKKGKNFSDDGAYVRISGSGGIGFQLPGLTKALNEIYTLGIEHSHVDGVTVE